MNFIVEDKDISILFVFNNINAYFDKTKDKTDYYVNVFGIYIKYK